MRIVHGAGANLFCPDCGMANTKEFKTSIDNDFVEEEYQDFAYNYFSCSCGKAFYFIVKSDQALEKGYYAIILDIFEGDHYRYSTEIGKVLMVNPKSLFVKFQSEDKEIHKAVCTNIFPKAEAQMPRFTFSFKGAI